MQAVVQNRRRKTDAGTAPPAVSPPAKDWRECQIIINDSDRFTRSLTRTVLQQAGAQDLYSSTCAEDAMELVEHARNPILVLSWKLGMKREHTGPELIRQVRRSAKDFNTPTMVLSAGRRIGDIELARDCGADSVSIWPIATQELGNRMSQISEAPRQFIRSSNYVGPCRRSTPNVETWHFKRQVDVDAGKISHIKAIRNQAGEAVRAAERQRDPYKVRVGRSLAVFTRRFADMDARAKEVVDLHKATLFRLDGLHQSDTQSRQHLVEELERLVVHLRR